MLNDAGKPKILNGVPSDESTASTTNTTVTTTSTPTINAPSPSRRIPVTQAAFDDIHLKKDRKRTPLTEKLRSNCYCSKKRLWKIVSSYIPLVKVIRYYKLKEYLLIDFLAGITIGIMHIPQALGFGMLASVKIVNGLYTSFWPIVLYLIFGTSPHVSIGTSAVICILTAGIVDRESIVFKKSWMNGTIYQNDSDFNWESIPQFMDYKEETAMVTALIAGLVLLIMGFLKLGFITAYLSESFFSAFTSGAAVHIATSQMATMLGLIIPKHSGMLKIIYTYRDIFSNIASSNVAEVIIAVCAIVILLLVKDCINDRFKHKLKVPIPIELIVVVMGTVLCYLFKFNTLYDVKIIGQITTEIPVPKVPSMARAQNILVDSFIIAILIFANTIAMAKICAKKHNYEVDDSQELIAYGMCNFVSAFMFCFPSSIAPPRSLVASSMGVKTNINAVFTSILMFLILSVITSLFETLPKTVLGAVITIALKGLFMQIADVKKFYHINIFDFIIWMSTFLGVVFLDIDYGLYIGVCVSFITVVFQTQFANGYRLGRVPNEGLMVEHKLYLSSQEIKGIKIFRFESNLYFANAEIFRGLLYKKTVNPRKYLKQLQKREKQKLKKNVKPLFSSVDLLNRTSDLKTEEKKAECRLDNPVFSLSSEESPSTTSKTSPQKGVTGSSVSFVSSGRPSIAPVSGIRLHDGRRTSCTPSMDSSIVCLEEEEDPEDGGVLITEEKFSLMKSVHHVIIDFSRVNYMDASGANVLSHICTEYEHVNIRVFLACCSHSIWQTMVHAGVIDRYTKSNIFLTLSDAISQARIENVEKKNVDFSDFSDEEAAEDSYITKL